MEHPHTPYTHGPSSRAGSSSQNPIPNAALSVGGSDRGEELEELEEVEQEMVPETLFEGLITPSCDEVVDMGHGPSMQPQFSQQHATQQHLSPRALEKSVHREMYPRPSALLSSGSSEASSSTLVTSLSSRTRSRQTISQVQEGLREQRRRAVENSLAEAGVEMELADGQVSGQRLGMMMNTLAEQEIDLMIQQERQALLTKSTVSMYERYQRHWVEWCRRKGYPDINVYCKKFQRYMAENVAEEPDPMKGIEPLRANPKVRSQQRLAYDPNLPLPSYETVDAYIKAAIDLYVSQKSDSSNKAMQNEPHPRSAHVRTLMKKYQLRVAALKKSMVSTDLTFDEGNDLEVLRQTMKTAWTHKYRHLGGGRKHDVVGLRTRLNAVWSHYMVMRGENMRMATLADLATHTVNQGNSGGQSVVGISLSMLRGKTNREGKENKGVIVRSKDVEVCPVGAFVLYLYELWMHPRSPPDFNEHSWSEIFILYAGGDPLKQLSHSAQYRHAATMWNKSANPTNKPTHAHRGSEARHALAAGADIASIAQAGHWSVDRVATHYLDRHSAQVALKMAGCTLPGERLWLARNTLIPPIDLQRQVFPFIEHYFTDSEDWLVWTSNIMMDRDIFEDRPSNTRMKILSQDIPKLRILLLLTHLRKVLLQDAAVLINLRTSEFRYGEHHIFRDRLFGSTLFLRFQERLLHSIETTRSPVSDSLAANAPAINHEFRSLHMRDEQNNRVLNELLKTTSAVRNEQREDLMEATSTIKARIDDRFSALVSFAFDISSGLTQAITNLSQREQQGADQGRQPQSQQNLNGLRQLQQDQMQGLQLLRNLGPSPQLAQAQELYIQLIEKTQQLIQPQGHQLLHTLQPHVRVQRSQVERQLPGEEQETAAEQEQAVVEQEDEQEQQSEIHQEATLHLPDQEQALQPPEHQPQPEEHDIEDQMDQMEEALAYPRYQPPFIADHIMLGRDDPLRDQWKEWFFGLNGQPSLWQLNKHYKSKWRKGSDQKANTRSKQFYYKRRLIRSVLKTSLRMPGSTLELRVEAALQSVEEQLQTMSMNRYVKTLDVER